jgi:hypothetical protein
LRFLATREPALDPDGSYRPLPVSHPCKGSDTRAHGSALEKGMIKLDDKVGTSRKFARNIPFWA